MTEKIGDFRKLWNTRRVRTIVKQHQKLCHHSLRKRCFTKSRQSSQWTVKNLKVSIHTILKNSMLHIIMSFQLCQFWNTLVYFCFYSSLSTWMVVFFSVTKKLGTFNLCNNPHVHKLQIALVQKCDRNCSLPFSSVNYEMEQISSEIHVIFSNCS